MINNLSRILGAARKGGAYESLRYILKGWKERATEEEVGMPRSEEEYRERRDFIRMRVSTEVAFRPANGEEQFKRGETINLSATGVLFLGAEPIPEGELLELKVMPEHERIPPLEAQGRVIRCAAVAGGSESYEIAVSFEAVR